MNYKYESKRTTEISIMNSELRTFRTQTSNQQPAINSQQPATSNPLPPMLSALCLSQFDNFSIWQFHSLAIWQFLHLTFCLSLPTENKDIETLFY